MEYGPLTVLLPDLWKDVPLVGRFWLAVPTRVRLAVYRCAWWLATKLSSPRTRWMRLRQVLPGIYLKHGFIRPSEPQAMALIRRHTHLRSSVALDYIGFNVTSPYTRDDDGPRVESYLLMTAVCGERLDDVMDTLSPEQITRIGLDLRSYLAALHDIPNHYPYDMCSSAGTPIDAPRFTGETFDVPTFEDMRSFHAWVRKRMFEHWPTMQPMLEPIFAKYEEQKTIFSHGDLSYGNIMIRNSRFAGLIDWETSGWLPPYWDYLSADYRPGDLCETITKLAIPQDYDTESRVMRKAGQVARGLNP